MKERGIISIILIVASVIFGSPASAATLNKIKFPYSPIAWQSLPWWMAMEAKLFEKHGLDVEMAFEGASSVIIQAMLAGEANFAGLAGPAVVANVLKGGDVIQVAAIIKTFTIPMFVQPSIKQLADLKGKKLGVSRFGSVSHLTAQAILQRAGISDVTILQTGGIPESTAALSSGNVAAAMVPPPQSVLLKDKGFRELVGVNQLKEMNIRFIENGIAARRSYAEKNPDVLKRFMRAAFEGMKKIYDDKNFTLRVTAKYTKINDPRMLDESYRFAIDAFVKDPSVPPEALESMLEQMVSLKSIEATEAKKTPVTAYYDNRYIEELEKEGFFKKLWQ